MRESTFTNAICKAESKQISKDFAYCEDALGRAENAIGNLPSVQPEKRTEERAETHACDCISRQAAIDAISCNITITGRQNAELVAATIGAFADRIKALPSAEPERKKGRWLPDNIPGGGFWVCSCCKFPSEAFAADVLYKFCPNCGADMRKARWNG